MSQSNSDIQGALQQPSTYLRAAQDPLPIQISLMSHDTSDVMQLTASPSLLNADAPPPGYYAWSECTLSDALSDASTATAFKTGLDTRDIFFGLRCCIICGEEDDVVDDCYIIPKVEKKTWARLKERCWLSQQAKDHPEHDPRNGISMCGNHHMLFDGFYFFIRFVPEVRKFVMIRYSDRFDSNLAPFHGKAVALDITDKHAPFPSLFLVHERRVRKHNPDYNPRPSIPVDIMWQDWITQYNVWNPSTSHFNRDGEPDRASGQPNTPSSQPSLAQTSSGESGSRMKELEYNDGVIVAILAVIWAMPPWNVREEDPSWAGTAEENRTKYLSRTSVTS